MLVKGDSGVVMDVLDSVASGLIASGIVKPVEDSKPRAKSKTPALPSEVEDSGTSEKTE